MVRDHEVRVPDHVDVVQNLEDKVADPAGPIAEPAFKRGDRTVEIRDLERMLADPADRVAHQEREHRDTST